MPTSYSKRSKRTEWWTASNAALRSKHDQNDSNTQPSQPLLTDYSQSLTGRVSVLRTPPNPEWNLSRISFSDSFFFLKKRGNLRWNSFSITFIKNMRPSRMFLTAVPVRMTRRMRVRGESCRSDEVFKLIFYISFRAEEKERSTETHFKKTVKYIKHLYLFILTRVKCSRTFTSFTYESWNEWFLVLDLLI